MQCWGRRLSPLNFSLSKVFFRQHFVNPGQLYVAGTQPPLAPPSKRMHLFYGFTLPGVLPTHNKKSMRPRLLNYDLQSWWGRLKKCRSGKLGMVKKAWLENAGAENLAGCNKITNFIKPRTAFLCHIFHSHLFHSCNLLPSFPLRNYQLWHFQRPELVKVHVHAKFYQA